MSASNNGIELKLSSRCTGDMAANDELNRFMARVIGIITLCGQNQFTDARGVLSKESKMKINLDDNNALADIYIYADDAKLLALLPFIDKRIDRQTGMKEVIFQVYVDETSEYPLKGQFKVKNWEIHAL